jgi:carbamoylphosphate synthase small subunit
MELENVRGSNVRLMVTVDAKLTFQRYVEKVSVGRDLAT